MIARKLIELNTPRECSLWSESTKPTLVEGSPVFQQALWLWILHHWFVLPALQVQNLLPTYKTPS